MPKYQEIKTIRFRGGSLAKLHIYENWMDVYTRMQEHEFGAGAGAG